MTAGQSIQSRLDFIGMDHATRQALRELQPLIADALPKILDQFYSHITKYPQIARLFSSEAAIQHAKEAQLRHWAMIAAASFDETYVQSVTRIGRTHNRLGLEPRWYIAGYSMIVTGLLREIEMKVAEGWFGRRALRERKAVLQNAMTRAAMLDMDFAISVYLDAAREEQQAAMRKLADDFESAVGEIIETVSSASTELEATAGTLNRTAERTQEVTTSVAAASEEASTNVHSVASATEELNASVCEISRQAHDSAQMANDAVEQARRTNDRVGELSKAAARIGDVVELINTIAGQTNLLALNATIEAARAGEAGRGFAVVASEVKALAEQTAKATGEIGQQISGIQTATRESVDAIGAITASIEKLSATLATIASAVEQQGAATQEISRNVQQAALGTQQVSSNVVDVERGASETGSASSQVLSAAQALSRESNHLKLEVGRFLDTVRVA